MEIIWLPLAEKALEAIFSFYEEISIQAARKIITDPQTQAPRCMQVNFHCDYPHF